MSLTQAVTAVNKPLPTVKGRVVKKRQLTTDAETSHKHLQLQQLLHGPQHLRQLYSETIQDLKFCQTTRNGPDLAVCWL
ncbi:hypothetical protein SUGI_0758910 [Cryptomeria japonica]|nr:hypothetical protein SUGI_0758910 [Cryptomeria japonica]